MLWLSSEAAMLLCKGWGKDSCTPLFLMFCPYVTLCYCWRYIARVSRRRENFLVSLHGRPLARDLHNTQCSRPAHRHPHGTVCPPGHKQRGQTRPSQLHHTPCPRTSFKGILDVVDFDLGARNSKNTLLLKAWKRTISLTSFT